MNGELIMELTQLYFFKTVARLGNVTKAAEELHITQSALSKSIARLEKTIGFSLFEHKRGRISISDSGNIFLRHIERALSEIEDGVNEGKEQSNNGHGLISFVSSVQHIMPDIIDPFFMKHPDIYIKECAYSSRLIKDQLLNNEIDFAITSVPVFDPKIEWIPIIDEEMVLLVNPSHPLANRKEVEIKDLKNERFICNDTGYDKVLLNQLFKETGYTPNIVLESSEGRVRDDMIKSGFGVALIPAMVAYEKGHMNNIGLNKTIKIKSKSCRMHTGILKRKGKVLSNISQQFYDFVMNRLIMEKEKIHSET